MRRFFSLNLSHSNVMARTLLLMIFFQFLIVNCSGTAVQNLDKQESFENRFSPGMTEDEVVDILKTIGDYQLTDTRLLENGDVILTFRTQSGEWGSPVYYFRFSAEHELIVLFPPTVH